MGRGKIGRTKSTLWFNRFEPSVGNNFVLGVGSANTVVVVRSPMNGTGIFCSAQNVKCAGHSRQITDWLIGHPKKLWSEGSTASLECSLLKHGLERGLDMLGDVLDEQRPPDPDAVLQRPQQLRVRHSCYLHNKLVAHCRRLRLVSELGWVGGVCSSYHDQPFVICQ